MEKVIVKQLTEIDEINLEKVAKWLYKWWAKEEAFTLDGVKCFIKSCMQKDKLPQTYGMFLNDTIIGIYMFTREDLKTRPDIYPWLANVYIDPKYRDKGYSKILLSSVKENALKNTKEKVLYGYTIHNGLYERYGWKFICNIDTFNKKDRIQRLLKLELYE